MSQRSSGKPRVERDAYQTPPWATHVLCDTLIAGGVRVPAGTIWEPAVGDGNMARVLKERFNTRVFGSDIVWGPDTDRVADFRLGLQPPEDCRAIITNPPYILDDEFLRIAVGYMQPVGGMVAMLLRVDFYSAKTRAPLFGECPHFAMKLVLTDRIRWFEAKCDDNGQISSPSENHAWFVWDFGGHYAASLHYAGMPATEAERLRNAIRAAKDEWRSRPLPIEAAIERAKEVA